MNQPATAAASRQASPGHGAEPAAGSNAQLLADQQWVARVVVQVGAAAVCKQFRSAGFDLDKTGALIAKRGDCDQCGRYALLHRAFNEDRFLCPLCWHQDLCST